MMQQDSQVISSNDSSPTKVIKVKLGDLPLTVNIFVSPKCCTVHRPTPPIMKMSTEVTRNIFLLACGAGLLAPSKEPSQDPLRLSLQLVCKDWKRIVRSIPQLWNDLVIMVMPTKTVPRQVRHIEMISLATVDSWLRRARSWLKFAKTSLINLDFRVYPCAEAETAEFRVRIFSFLADYRFKKLSIFACHPQLLDIDESLDASTYALERLSLNSPPWHYPSTPILYHQLLMPRLRYLTLGMDGIHLYKDILAAFPWNQLEQLVFKSIPQPELTADILCRCTSLAKCTLSIHQSDGDFRPLKSITLPKLEYLEITSDVVNSVIGGFLHAMVTPRLKSLYVSDSNVICPFTMDQVEHMAQRSGFQENIEKVVLKRLAREISLGRLLKIMPCLRHVELSSAIIDLKTSIDVVLGSLGARLEVLHLETRGVDDPSILLNMLEIRQKVADTYVVPFSSAVFSFPWIRVRDFFTTHAEQYARLQIMYGSRLVIRGFRDWDTGVDEWDNDTDGSDDVEDQAGSVSTTEQVCATTDWMDVRSWVNLSPD